MSLASIISSVSHLSLTPSNRVKCSITGHEIPADLKLVQQYLTSKKLLKAKEWYSADFTRYLPYIIEHKRDSKKLFCRLTRYAILLHIALCL
jgi:Surfeit locus protein 2 (SURF2)